MTEKIYFPTLLLLRDKLRKVYDNDEFLLGVLSHVWESEEDQKAVIQFIDADNDVDDETIIVLAIELHESRTSQN